MILTTQQLKTITHLVYLGNYVLNANRLQKNRLTVYDRMAELIYQEYFNVTEQSTKDFTIDDFSELLSEELEVYITKYEENALPCTFAKMFAQKIYPITTYNDKNADKHLITEELIEEEINKNGLKHIKIDIPDFENQIMNAENSLKIAIVCPKSEKCI